jgi:hypothetical protein
MTAVKSKNGIDLQIGFQFSGPRYTLATKG